MPKCSPAFALSSSCALWISTESTEEETGFYSNLPWACGIHMLRGWLILCLITPGCLNVMFGGGRGENTPMWNVQTQDIAQTGNQRTMWCAFLSLSVVHIGMQIPVFSNSCGDYNHSEKGTYCKEDWKKKTKPENLPVHLKQKFIKTNPQVTELYCSVAHNSHNAF